MRRFLVAVLLILVLSTCILPAFAADDFDFQPYIDTFVSDNFHDIELKVGETHKANGAIWIGPNSDGGAYSSNEAVVTVNGGGQVTAVGEGTAYVVIVAGTGMSATTRYTVVKKTFFNSFKLQDLMFILVPGFILAVFVIVILNIVKASKSAESIANLAKSRLEKQKAPVVQQTPEEAQAAREAFGRGGEDNVWHSLKSLPDFGTYDVFRDIRIDGTENSNQIDAIVLSETGGVFLLEVKSIGGQKDRSGVRVVSLNQMKEDPCNQILRHRAAFLRKFEKFLPSPDSVRDLLVISYPHGDERRTVNTESFRGNPYDVVSVDRLLAYFTTQKGAALTPAQRQLLTQQLVACCKEFVLCNL